MSTDLTHLTPNQIATMTGIAPQTVTKRLVGLEPVGRNGRARLYDSRKALAMVFEARLRTGGDGLNLQEEQARSAAARADKIEMENDVQRRNLIPAERITKALERVFAKSRSKLLSIPTRAAPVVALMDNAAEVQAVLLDNVAEALRELEELDLESDI